MNNTFDVEKWVGLTRPLVTFMLIATACYLAIVGRIEVGRFLELVTIVALFWFKERSDEKNQRQVIEQIREIKTGA